jgi:hypothetical protein
MPGDLFFLPPLRGGIEGGCNSFFVIPVIVNLPRYCGQSEKLLQKSKEDEDVIKEIIYKGV